MYGTVHIDGLRELNRAFSRMNRDASKAVRERLKKAGEPVRTSAERLAVSEIGNIGPDWSRMRLGATSSSVYVAPAARSRGGSPRPNLAPLLLGRAMFPALEENEDRIVREVELAIDDLADGNGF